MSETKPVQADNEEELSEAEIANISGGLNPQPLPPGIVADADHIF